MALDFKNEVPDNWTKRNLNLESVRALTSLFFVPGRALLLAVIVIGQASPHRASPYPAPSASGDHLFLSYALMSILQIGRCGARRSSVRVGRTSSSHVCCRMAGQPWEFQPENNECSSHDFVKGFGFRLHGALMAPRALR